MFGITGFPGLLGSVGSLGYGTGFAPGTSGTNAPNWWYIYTTFRVWST